MERTAGSRSSTDASVKRAQRAAGVRRAGPRPSGGSPPEPISVGRVVGAHGLRGGLRVRLFAEGPESLLGLRRVELAGGEQEAARGYDVRRVAPGRPGELRLDLVGLGSREQALAQKGCLVLADPRELAPLGEGEYYGYQLLGCRVEGEDGSAVGTVREIWETGASDLLVVEGEGGARHLVPAVLLRRLDAEARRIVVELLPGLLEG